MSPSPEQEARIVIDRMLFEAGWLVQDVKSVNLHASRGVAIREFPLERGFGFADYLLYIDGKAAGVLEAKKAGVTLSGVEIQSDRYTQGLALSLPAWFRPLPFRYQSTGIETRFTSGLDPDPRSRQVFSFHRPETLVEWLDMACRSAESTTRQPGTVAEPGVIWSPDCYRSRLRRMPPLHSEGLWPAQFTAINNLEKSLAADRPRSLVQMATGSGKTFTSVSFIYRQLKFAGARRVLFLVDRANLGRQTLKEFQQYQSPTPPTSSPKNISSTTCRTAAWTARRGSASAPSSGSIRSCAARNWRRSWRRNRSSTMSVSFGSRLQWSTTRPYHPRPST